MLFNGTFLQRVSITCYAERCTSYDKSVCPTVRLSICLTVHLTLVFCQNDSYTFSLEDRAATADHQFPHGLVYFPRTAERNAGTRDAE